MKRRAIAIGFAVLAGCTPPPTSDRISKDDLLDLCEGARRQEVAAGDVQAYEELGVATREEWSTDLTDGAVTVDGWMDSPDDDGLYFMRGRTGDFKWVCFHSNDPEFTRWAADG